MEPINNDKSNEGKGEENSADTAAAAPLAEAKNTDNGADDKLIPKSRFDEVNSRMKELAEWKKDREASEAAAEAKRLEEAQEWQTLADNRKTELDAITGERDDLATKAERMEASLTRYRDAEMENVPEHIKPLLAKLDLVDQLAYLADNRESLTAKTPSGVPPSPDPKESGTSDAERREAAYQSSL